MKVKVILLIAIFLFSARTLFGEFDTLFVRKWLMVVQKFQDNGQYDSAIYVMEHKILPELGYNSKSYLEGLITLSGFYLKKQDTNRFESYLRNVDSLAAQSGYVDTRARALSNLGILEDDRGDFSNAILYYKKSIRLFLNLGDSLSSALVKRNLAYTYTRLDDYNTAIHIYQEVLDIYRKFHYDNGIAKIYDALGAIYRGMKDYLGSIKSYRKAIKILKEKKEVKALIPAYIDISVVFLEAKKLDSANIFLEKCYEIKKDMPIDLTYGLIFENWGEVSFKQHKYALAKRQLAKGMEVYRKIGYKEGIINIRIWQAEVLLATGHIQEARDKLMQSFNELRHFPGTNSKKMALNALRDIQLAEHDYRSAYQTMKRIHLFYDSLYEVQKAEAVLNAKILYNTNAIQEKNKQLKAKNYTNELKIANLRMQIYIYVLLIIIIVVLSLGYVFYNRQKKRQLILEKESETLRLIRNEKDKISMELHDLIGGEIFGMLLQYQIIGNILKDERIQRLNDAFGKVYEKVRGYSRTLKNIDAKNLPLEISILNLTHRFEAGANIRIKSNVASFDWQELEAGTKEHIYHIVQEAVINALKYSGADVIEIIFEKKKKEYRFSITDNGKGFDIHKLEDANGLTNIRERVEKIGGSLSVETKAGKGTKISVIVNNIDF